MTLLPIDVDEARNKRFRSNPECVAVLSVYPEYYKRVGFNKPWIGYFVTIDGQEIVGACGFKGKPKDGKVEIAYGTFKEHEGKGLGTQMCGQLVALASRTDPSLKITARTFTADNASASILRRNGFEYQGIVFDEEDGDVCEWEYGGVAV